MTITLITDEDWNDTHESIDDLRLRCERIEQQIAEINQKLSLSLGVTIKPKSKFKRKTEGVAKKKK